MSYCTGKNIEIARGKAVKMLVVEKKPVGVVAGRFGVNRSTIWRWHQKWKKLNSHIQFTNAVRRQYLGISPRNSSGPLQHRYYNEYKIMDPTR